MKGYIILTYIYTYRGQREREREDSQWWWSCQNSGIGFFQRYCRESLAAAGAACWRWCCQRRNQSRRVGHKLETVEESHFSCFACRHPAARRRRDSPVNSDLRRSFPLYSSLEISPSNSQPESPQTQYGWRELIKPFYIQEE